jgi:rhamnogalacturonyl hydrolase YesR
MDFILKIKRMNVLTKLQPGKSIFTFVLIAFLSMFCQSQNQKMGLDEKYKSKIESSLTSGIVHASTVCLDKEGKAKGDYELVSGEWTEYEPAWHTGQLIKGLLDAYEVTKSEKALQHAKKAGDWWVTLQFPQGHPLEGYMNAVHGDKVGNLINTTTIADGTPGLFQLSRVTGDDKYADVATSAGAWILDNLYVKEHKLSYNIVDPDTGEIWKDKSPHEQHQDDPITIKQVARPNAEGYLWKDMYDHTGEERYKEAYLEICDGLLEKQSDNGFWMDFEPNDPKTGKIHARFNTWNAEALLEAYDLTKDKKYLEGALKTGRGLVSIQDKNGIIYYTSYTNGSADKKSPCGSGTSFAGILWLRLYQLGHQEFKDNIKDALDFTLQNQFPENHEDPNLADGYFEMRLKIKKGNVKMIYRDIANAFGLRFLSEVYKYEFQ